MQNKIHLQYPVILVHGIIAHDRGRKNLFWGRIPKTLQEKGISVYFGNTDAWGSFDSNAKILKSTIEQVLGETKTEKVNIIAQSKGGLDARYLIHQHGYGNKVASLTTLSTPHHGSELADHIYSQKNVHFGLAKKALKLFEKLCGDKNPDLYTVNYLLTTHNMKKFNEKITADDRVYYQSFYTTMKNSTDDLMFLPCHSFMKKVCGENDGFVGEKSAHWGTNVIKIDGSISHGEILDLKRRKISGIDIRDIYVNIATDLARKGM